VRGKAHDDSFMVHDFALREWLGANSFRTSRYPYAEEVLEYADRHGIVVTGETAAVGLNATLGGVRERARVVDRRVARLRAIVGMTFYGESFIARGNRIVLREERDALVVRA
jgi:beta-galactosidase/beta-glucuronidase